jgi:NADPH:quinone reductase
VRAVLIREFGPPEVLVPADVPDPVPAPGQVVVEVELAGVTFVETQIRAGRPPSPAMAPALPAILGNGVAGLAEGRRVITTTGGSGGYAERAAVDAAGVIEVPEEIGAADALALLADGRTAVALMRAVGVRAGERLLVEAAAGGVGSLLVQLARNAGAHVVAAAGGPRKLELAAELGAEVTVDYTRPGWAEGLGGVDVVLDGVGGAVGREAFALLRSGGRFCAYGMAGGAFAGVSDEDAARRGARVVRGAGVAPGEMADLTRAALAEAVAGRLRPVIGQTFPLERAADAHAAIEARATLGKTLLVVAERPRIDGI